MTTTVQPESKPRSRRALLAGALAGIGAWAASAIGRTDPVRATDGQPIVQGADNSGSTSTVVRISSATAALQGVTDATSGTSYGLRGRNSSTAGAGVLGVAGAASGSAWGIHGTTNSPNGTGVRGDSTASGQGNGVWGTSPTSVGVRGSSSGSGTGVFGTASTGVGVFGQSNATNNPATLGVSLGDSAGVLGGSGSRPNAKAKTGVQGYAAQDATSIGVYGESPSGRGLHGKTSTGYAGYFEGKVYTNKWYELTEISTPPSPSVNRARLFIKENGLGKTQVCVKFANGTVKVLATEG